MPKTVTKHTTHPKEFESNSRYKLAPVSHAYKTQFARDMNKFMERLSLTIQRHREAHRANPTEHSKRQLQFFLAQRAGVKTLASINKQRRGLNATR